MRIHSFKGDVCWWGRRLKVQLMLTTWRLRDSVSCRNYNSQRQMQQRRNIMASDATAGLGESEGEVDIQPQRTTDTNFFTIGSEGMRIDSSATVVGWND